MTQEPSRSSGFAPMEGQVLAIFAGALVVLLLIGALVVDLGFVFLKKRQEQNAADPGAVAAARYANPQVANSGGNPEKRWQAACFYAIENGFRATRTDGNGTCDPGGTSDGSTITVNYPPSAGGGAFAGKPGYVEVVISSTHQSFLAGVIGLAQFNVKAAAVAANDDNTGGSSSLVALNPTKCAAAKINGGGGAGGISIIPAAGVTDPGGYIQVNSDCGGDGSAAATDDACTNVANGGMVMDGGSSLSGPALFVRGACDKNGSSGYIDPGMQIDENGSYVGDPLALLRPPAPADLVTRQCGTGAPSTAISPKQCQLKDTVTLDPGTYYGGWKIATPGASVTLNPGLYIIAGGGIDDTGGILTSASGQVLIFSTDASPAFRSACINNTASTADGCQKKLSMAGGASLNLTGLSFSASCPPYSSSGCPYAGMLLWQDGMGSASVVGGQNCDIALGGSSSLVVSGTIYASCGNVKIIGNNNSSGCTTGTNCASVQIISDTWEVGGAAVLEMPYDPNKFYHLTLKGLVK